VYFEIVVEFLVFYLWLVGLFVEFDCMVWVLLVVLCVVFVKNVYLVV